MSHIYLLHLDPSLFKRSLMIGTWLCPFLYRCVVSALVCLAADLLTLTRAWHDHWQSRAIRAHIRWQVGMWHNGWCSRTFVPVRASVRVKLLMHDGT
ncbi:hypothetical protein L226DRAFT_396519 [Lentinus tigrinus ALCF2SS1-7]|uniref:uncharacterized protein n=1 Tax=Lentinus tigrinus ALCF2SS1-7 TaxID=1328758 RepID=UPI00116615EC|nr:hypothetical protein L226DRAFT_396519 [Lentinus tigrinus ALCF2SS1-7]